MSSFEIIAYPLLPISALELLLGFLLLGETRRSNPQHRSVAAIAFFASAYALNTAVMYLMASRGHDFNFFARLNWIGWFAIPAALQFIYYLRSDESRAARTVGYVLYPYWTVVLALSLFTELIVTRDYALIPYRNEPGPLEVPARIIGAATIIWLIIEILRTRRVLRDVRRFQLDYFFYGSLIFALGGAMIAGVLPAVHRTGIEPGLGSYFGLPWVVLTFYAMVRHSLFEMRIIVSRTFSILIAILIFSVVQAALLTELRPVFGTALSSFISLSLVGFFLFGTPVNRKIQSFVNSIVVGDRYNYGAQMREAIVALNEKQAESELIDRLLDATATGPGVSEAGLFLHRAEDGFALRQGRGRFADRQGKSVLPEGLVKELQATNRSIVLAAMAGSEQDPETFYLKNYLRGIGAEALVPLLFQGTLQGALVLGPKVNGEAYGQIDIGFLETMAAHAASALANARLDELARQIRFSLQESEERFMTLAQKMPVTVLIHRGAQIVYANDAAKDLTGYEKEQLLSMHIHDLIHPAYRSTVPLSSPGWDEPRTRGAAEELRVLQDDGNERWVVMVSSFIEFGEQIASLRILFDLTEQKRAEGKLRYERIRDAVGRMASYLARDLDAMVKDLDLDSVPPATVRNDRPDLEKRARAMAQNLEVLIGTLRELTATAKTKRTLQDLNELVSKVRPILSSLLTGKHALVLQTEAGRLPVMADPMRMERALMNLVTYARDQMPRGGSIAMATGRTTMDTAFIRRSGYGKSGSYATISISDEGGGMDTEELERIFEPFFLPRGDWMGSGIGLPLVYDIVKDHEGYITAASQAGRGSTFTVYLPLLG